MLLFAAFERSKSSKWCNLQHLKRSKTRKFAAFEAFQSGLWSRGGVVPITRSSRTCEADIGIKQNNLLSIKNFNMRQQFAK